MINHKAYLLLAGNPTRWDLEIRKNTPLMLTTLQERQHSQGRRSAQIYNSLYGWYVRSDSGLDRNQILARTTAKGGILDGSFTSALQWGKDWANEDQENREFCILRSWLQEVSPEELIANGISPHEAVIKEESK